MPCSSWHLKYIFKSLPTFFRFIGYWRILISYFIFFKSSPEIDCSLTNPICNVANKHEDIVQETRFERRKKNKSHKITIKITPNISVRPRETGDSGDYKQFHWETKIGKYQKIIYHTMMHLGLHKVLLFMLLFKIINTSKNHTF